MLSLSLPLHAAFSRIFRLYAAAIMYYCMLSTRCAHMRLLFRQMPRLRFALR